MNLNFPNEYQKAQESQFPTTASKIQAQTQNQLLTPISSATAAISSAASANTSLQLTEKHQIKDLGKCSSETSYKEKASTEQSAESNSEYCVKCETKQDVKTAEKIAQPSNPIIFASQLLPSRDNKPSSKEKTSSDGIPNLFGFGPYPQNETRVYVKSLTKITEPKPKLEFMFRKNVKTAENAHSSVTSMKRFYDVSESEIEAIAKAIIAEENAGKELRVDLLKSANHMNLLALSLGKQGYQYLEIKCYLRGLELHPEDPKRYGLYYNCALIYVNNNQFLKAIEFFHNSLKVNPHDFLSMEWLAYTYNEINEFDESIDWCEKAIEREPNNPNGPFRLGSYLMNKLSKQQCHVLAKWHEAIKHFQKAAEMIETESKKPTTSEKLLSEYQQLNLQIQSFINNLTKTCDLLSESLKEKASTEQNAKYDGKYESKQDVKTAVKDTKSNAQTSHALQLLLPRLKGLTANDLTGNTIRIIKNKLCLFEKDMRLLIDFLKKNPSITTLNLAGVLTEQVAGLEVLAAGLPHTSVTLVKLSCDISKMEKEAFAKAMTAAKNAGKELKVDHLKL